MTFDPNTDYSGQLDEMLAPYQKMASQLTSPYATMRPNSWLAQNHPRMAGILDNAFLTAGMTPEAQGPEGVGGGISRTMQGLMGAQQFHRQQAMTAAMLPYQMLQPRLQAEDTLAQIQERHGSAIRADAYMTGMNERERHNQQMEDIGQQRTDAYAQHIDDLQNKYDKDPIGTLGSKGGTLERLAGAQTPRIEGESDTEYATRYGDTYLDLYARSQGLGAGARKGAEEATPHTYEDARILLNNEHSAMQQSLPKIQSESEYEKAHLTDPNYYNDPNAYQKYKQQTQMEIDKEQYNFSTYLRSGAYKQGIGYREFLKNPNQASTKAAASTAPKNSGKAWVEKQ